MRPGPLAASAARSSSSAEPKRESTWSRHTVGGSITSSPACHACRADAGERHSACSASTSSGRRPDPRHLGHEEAGVVAPRRADRRDPPADVEHRVQVEVEVLRFEHVEQRALARVDGVPELRHLGGRSPPPAGRPSRTPTSSNVSRATAIQYARPPSRTPSRAFASAGLRPPFGLRTRSWSSGSTPPPGKTVIPPTNEEPARRRRHSNLEVRPVVDEDHRRRVLDRHQLGSNS